MAIKSISPEVSDKAAEVIGQLNLMAEKGKEIHKAQDAARLRTNSSLYELLSTLYESYVELISDSDLLGAVLEEMKQALVSKGQRVQKNQSLNTFVRFVFGSDRQRTYNYKRCLQAALDQKVHPKGFKVFIVREGGIEACKSKNKSKSPMANKSKVQVAYAKVEKTLSSTALATIKLPPEVVADATKNRYTFLLAKAKPNGDVDVLALVPDHNPSLEAWAICSITEAVNSQDAEGPIVKQGQNLIEEAVAQAECLTG